jgi:hypothetical protein
MQSDPSERRHATRYQLEVPIIFDGHEGWTRDASSRGVYFLAVPPFETGDIVDLKFTLAHASVLGPLHLQLRGRVIRVEMLGDLKGVAAEIDSWEVLDDMPDASPKS